MHTNFTPSPCAPLPRSENAHPPPLPSPSCTPAFSPTTSSLAILVVVADDGKLLFRVGDGDDDELGPCVSFL